MFMRLFRKRPDPEMAPNMRVYAVGDIHGQFDLLLEIVERIRIDNAMRSTADTEIILLGDLIDRGPDSAEVVRWAMNADLGFASVSIIQGNHETSMVNALAGDLDWMERWLFHGGGDSLASWGVSRDLLYSSDLEAILDAARAAVPADQLAWLNALPFSRRLGDYMFVHAGVRPGIALEEQDERDLVWIRDEFLSSTIDHGAMIVHGHTITQHVDVRANRVGIDTGAFRTGRLTAMGLEGTERWFLRT